MIEIKITEQLREDIKDMCEDELDWKIYSSGCAEDYDGTIRTMCELLKLIGYKDEAEGYMEDYEKEDDDDEEDDEEDEET